VKSTVQAEEVRSPGKQGRRSKSRERDSIRGSGISAFRVEAIGRLPVEIARSRGAKFRGIS
jgi:hypothetical protein